MTKEGCDRGSEVGQFTLEKLDSANCLGALDRLAKNHRRFPTKKPCLKLIKFYVFQKEQPTFFKKISRLMKTQTNETTKVNMKPIPCLTAQS